MSADTEIELFDGLCSLRWLGTNCLLIKTRDAGVMVDPHFSRPRFPALIRKIAPQTGKIHQELEKLDLARLDAILLTHTHYDHFLDALETARLTGADLYGSESAVQAEGTELAGRFIQVKPGVQYSIGDIKAGFYASSHLKFIGKLSDWLHFNEKIEKPVHPPASFLQYRAGTVYSILLEIKGYRLWIQGSAGIDNEEDAIPQADAAVLSIAGLGIKSRQYRRTWFEQTVRQSGVREVWFSHWDFFFLPWSAHPYDMPGTRLAERHIAEMSAADPQVTFKRLMPG